MDRKASDDFDDDDDDDCIPPLRNKAKSKA
jgi:hypothetical protein